MAIGKKKVMIIKKQGISFFQFSNLSRFSKIHHGVFTRKGGFSPKPFESLNISFGVGDRPENVKKNRQAVAELFDSEKDDCFMVYLRQVHSDQVCIIDNEVGSKILYEPGTPFSADAAITNLPGRNLVIQIADCQSVLLYDPGRHVVANIHSGWRGSIQNVIGKTIRAMIKRFMSDPKDIVAAIGPSLGPCCSEFVNYRKEIPKIFWKYRISSNYFDFWRMSRDQMTSEGVLNENIENSELCTKCRTDLFFSYRGEKVTGRFSTVLGLDHR